MRILSGRWPERAVEPSPRSVTSSSWLAGGDGFQDILTDALGLDAFDELAGNLEMDVGGEQGGAHFLERLGHVFLGELADAAEVAQGVAQFFGERFEHCGGVKTGARCESAQIWSWRRKASGEGPQAGALGGEPGAEQAGAGGGEPGGIVGRGDTLIAAVRKAAFLVWVPREPVGQP
jgi:hypothetical protein